jgi:hypothetical protein
LDAHRKRVQTQHGLTLTGLYNVLEKIRAGEDLTDKEKLIHDKGLISTLKSFHDDLDAAVSAAYGWPDTLTDAEILERLVALNAERTAEETLRRKDEKSVAMHVTAKHILDQLDLALGFILRNLNTQLWFRGEVTKDTDFLCEVLGADTKAGGRIARMVRRYQQLHPEDDGTDFSFAESFAWDVYQRVAELDGWRTSFPTRSATQRGRCMPGRCSCTGTRTTTAVSSNSPTGWSWARNIRPTPARARGSGPTHRWCAISNR